MGIVKSTGKRKRVRWFNVMRSLQNADIEHDFIDRLSVLYKGTHLSVNRCAYYALKNYYHTTSIDDLCEVLGL